MSLQFNTEEEVNLLREALCDLRQVKVDAMETLNKHLPFRKWEPIDFGIPTIDKMLEKVEAHDETLDV